MPSSISDARRAVEALAREEGFDIVRFTRAEAAAGAREHLRDFLGENRHGSMEWMARDPDRRADPHALWPDAISIVVLGANYGPEDEPLALLERKDTGSISVYARGLDYHDVLKKKLKKIGGRIATDFRADVKVFVDTAPVMEKPLAQKAGAGWQGKHTNLVSREFGSWLFLASIFTTLDLGADEPEEDHCGQCRRCLDVCPTNAFPAPYELDARRCISYLTIEHKGHIAREFRTVIGNRIYGCDDCLAVCPWNKFAQYSRETQFHAREELKAPRLADLARLDDAAFRMMFRGSPIKRTGRDRFVRNVLIAIGNSKDVQLASVAEALLADASPLVRAMAVWALSQLVPNERFAQLAQRHADNETDADVSAEWREAFSPAAA